MSEIITLEGLRKLVEMEESERPKNWKGMVLLYCKQKQRVYDDRKRKLQLLEEELLEISKLCRRLGIVWNFKF
jgi:hypothetical protein